MSFHTDAILAYICWASIVLMWLSGLELRLTVPLPINDCQYMTALVHFLLSLHPNFRSSQRPYNMVIILHCAHSCRFNLYHCPLHHPAAPHNLQPLHLHS